jgi:hypothetical protein
MPVRPAAVGIAEGMPGIAPAMAGTPAKDACTPNLQEQCSMTHYQFFRLIAPCGVACAAIFGQAGSASDKVLR